MNRNREQASVVSRLVRAVLIGAVAGVVAGVLFLLAAAAVMASVDIPARAVTPIAMVGVALAALVGGFIAARMLRERGLLIGAGCGLLIFFIVALAGFTVESAVAGTLLFLKLALTVGFGALGGVFGVNMKRR